MSLVWTGIGVGVGLGLAALLLALLLARRYRELREALIGAGLLRRRRVPAASLTRGAWLPEPGRPIPEDLLAVCTDGTALSYRDFAGPDVIVAFLASGCEPCWAMFPALCTALAQAPYDGPRPVVVLSGPRDGYDDYHRPLTTLARVVEDGDAKFAGLTAALGVRAYPSLLVIGGGQVRRVGLTLEEVGLPVTV